MTPAGAPTVFVIQHVATLRRDPVAQTGMDFPNEVELRVYQHDKEKGLAMDGRNLSFHLCPTHEPNSNRS
jgi:hypothetical protein